MSLTKKARSRRWRGFSLFGVILGLALAGVVIAGSVMLYDRASESQKRSETIQLISSLRTAVLQAYAGSASYGASNTDLVPILAGRGLIPEAALVDQGTAATADDTIRHPFGGAVLVQGNPSAGIATGATVFRIRITAVEREVCKGVGDTYVGRSRARSGLAGINIGTATGKAAPFTTAELDTECDKITAGGTGDIWFAFR